MESHDREKPQNRISLVTYSSEVDAVVAAARPISKSACDVSANDIVCKTRHRESITNDVDTTYDPHDYCTSPKSTSYYDSSLHLLKASVATGILAIPSAFQNAGYGVGIIGVFCMTAFYTYCIHLLVSSEYELCKRKKIPNMTYANTVRAAFEHGPARFRRFAKTGQICTNIIFVVYPTSGAAVYAVFIAQNMKNLIDYYANTDIDIKIVLMCLCVPLIMASWVSNLKLLAPLSAAANCIIMISFGIVFWYVFKERPSFENRRITGDIANLPTYLTTVLYAISCTNLVMPLKNTMKESKYFGSAYGVLNTAMVPISILYAVFGFFGYLKYGDDIRGSVTLNLPKDEILAQCVGGLYSTSIFLNYCLNCYVVFEIVWVNYLKSKIRRSNLVWEYACRTSIPAVPFLIAFAIPNLKIVISLVGALCTTTTSLAMPILIHTLVFWDKYETRYGFYMFFIKNTILFGVSFVIIVTGVSNSVTKIIKMYFG